jgi:muramoyltetrapeptide carboxypeptidase
LLTGGMANYTCPVHPYNRTGKAEGALVGGNLSLLVHLTGTVSDIRTKDKILFIEDVGEYLYNIDRMLWHLKRSGKLDKLAGLIIGGFTDAKDTERPFGKQVYDIIHDITKEYDYPVCFGFPISHEQENYALKTGVPHKLIITEEKVQLRESTE